MPLLVRKKVVSADCACAGPDANVTMQTAAMNGARDKILLYDILVSSLLTARLVLARLVIACLRSLGASIPVVHDASGLSSTRRRSHYSGIMSAARQCKS